MRNEKFDWFQKNRVGTANQHSIFLYLRLKKLAPGGIWTYHEVTTICHTNTICDTKRHMVYIWPEKGVFSYTYIWKSWHLVGFEPTLFGRAKVQPHYAYQLIARNAYGLYLTGKRCIFLYPHLKNLAPGGIWTHTVRAGEGATTLRVSVRLQSTPSLVVSLLSVAAVWLERYWPDS